MGNYIEPKIGNKAFTCPYCNTLSSMNWDGAAIIKYNIDDYRHFIEKGNYDDFSYIHISTCAGCGKYHIWYEDKMIYPLVSGVEMPNDDMPECVKDVYMEAREVFVHSKRASAALLRLAIQLLCKELGEKGKNINDDIASLVSKGLPVQIQKALDSIRVIGNNAVHPGVIELNDDNETASVLFVLINIIVEQMITQPKQINEIYSKLPPSALEGIAKRDKTTS